MCVLEGYAKDYEHMHRDWFRGNRRSARSLKSEKSSSPDSPKHAKSERKTKKRDSDRGSSGKPVHLTSFATVVDFTHGISEMITDEHGNEDVSTNEPELMEVKNLFLTQPVRTFRTKDGSTTSHPFIEYVDKQSEEFPTIGMTVVVNENLQHAVMSWYTHNVAVRSPGYTLPKLIANFPSYSAYNPNKGGDGPQCWPRSYYQIHGSIANGILKATDDKFLRWPSCSRMQVVNTHETRDTKCVNEDHYENEPYACGKYLKVGSIIITYGNDIHWVKECYYIGAYMLVIGDGNAKLGCKVGVVKAAYNQLHYWTNRVGVVDKIFQPQEGPSKEYRNHANGGASVTCLDGTMQNLKIPNALIPNRPSVPDRAQTLQQK
jgi:hypothetical protein